MSGALPGGELSPPSFRLRRQHRPPQEKGSRRRAAWRGRPRRYAENVAQCFAERVTTADGQIRAAAASPPPTALTPADIRAAYALPSGGDGMTVAVIDAGGYANAEQDLAVFRATSV